MNTHSTWRSLLPGLEDQPLALCDSRSVAETDLMPTDRLVPDRVGEVYYLKYNPKHRWFVSLAPLNMLELLTLDSSEVLAIHTKELRALRICYV
jgi:hypothetical protein